MRRKRALERFETVLLVAVGGFAGSNLRYFFDAAIPQPLAATFLVNVAGSFALAVLLYDATGGELFARRSRLVFGAGFLSSFTTYSTFVVEAFTRPDAALLYVGASYACGFGAVLVGRAALGRIDGGGH
ncbi:fluoride efflux transporter FluC [Halegenticoccus soli]|uniref:fluoride efflux transporter FluC n=1 Tax=Halegenticoccus soli TaxID=1985678 RepID=UPI000C6E90F0|nr:CrcB family protein [Halegenticoccus soli]